MQINIQKVIERLEELYLCGKQEDGTYSRVAYSPEDIKGREKFKSYFQSLGVASRTDKAGNLIFRLEGEDPSLPSIIIGSHLDTVPNGGKYDGVLGCVAGLGVCEALIETGQKLKHNLEVIVFTDEEGARFGNGMVGSGAFSSVAADFSDTDKDIYGMSRGDVFKTFGIDTSSLAQATREPGSVHCFIELHIEQGASLYKNSIPIGVVSSIAGVKRYEVTINGESNHAGSTMMQDRKDALVAAAGFIAAVPNMVEVYGEKYTVATVGVIKAEPGSVNVIPGVCTFSLEIRDQNQEVMDFMEQKLKAGLDTLCGKLTYSFRHTASHSPAPMTGWVRECIRKSCENLGYEYLSMPSGAFHDSLLVSSVFPTGMIFIPSEGGISHSPLEYTADADVAAGCNTLLRTILAADCE